MYKKTGFLHLFQSNPLQTTSMKLAILVSVIVAASALPNTDEQDSALLSRGRSQVKEVRLLRRKGKSGKYGRKYGHKYGGKYGHGSHSRSKGSKCSKSRSCGGHHHDDIWGGDFGGPPFPLPPAPAPAPAPAPPPSTGNKPASTVNTYGGESGNLPSDDTKPVGGGYAEGEVLADHVARLPAVCPSGEILTVVIAGDSLDEIAQANDYDLAILINANGQFPDPDLIYPGDQVCIPADCKTGYTGPVDTSAPVDPILVDAAPTDIDIDTQEEDLDDPALLESSAFRVVGSLIAAVAVAIAL
jgi:hypothetical protein